MYRTAGIPLSVKQWIMGWMPGVQFSAGVRDVSPSQHTGRLWVTQPPIQWVSGCSFWGGVRLSPLGTSATNWPIVAGLDNGWWVWRSWWNGIWQGKPKDSDKTCPSGILSAKNPTWPDLDSNLGRCGGKTATNRLSYGMAVYRCVLSPRGKVAGVWSCPLTSV
jgi:hypothetical protein